MMKMMIFLQTRPKDMNVCMNSEDVQNKEISQKYSDPRIRLSEQLSSVVFHRFKAPVP